MKLGFPIEWTIVTKFDSGRARTSDLLRVRRSGIYAMSEMPCSTKLTAESRRVL